MSDDMRARLKAEFAEYDRATMALSNAFGFIDNPKAWEGSEDEYVDMWWDAANVASNVDAAAARLAEAARQVATDLEDQLPEDEDVAA